MELGPVWHRPPQRARRLARRARAASSRLALRAGRCASLLARAVANPCAAFSARGSSSLSAAARNVCVREAWSTWARGSVAVDCLQRPRRIESVAPQASFGGVWFGIASASACRPSAALTFFLFGASLAFRATHRHNITRVLVEILHARLLAGNTCNVSPCGTSRRPPERLVAPASPWWRSLLRGGHSAWPSIP